MPGGGESGDGGGAEGRRARALGLVLAGSALLAVQGSLVRVALPAMRADLSTDVAGAQLIGLSALVVVIATLVPLGRLADLAGPGRVYCAGLAVLAAGSGASAAAPGTGWLVAAQALGGLGWSMCAGSGAALLVAAFGAVPADRVGSVSGALAMVGRLGLVVGIAVAGAVRQAGLDRYAGSARGSTRAFQEAFAVCAGFGVLATAASWGRGHLPAGRRGAGRGAAVATVEGHVGGPG